MADTVIVGAGIIGVSTAYYLSEHQPAETIHLVEASELFASASGYAGGFLAQDWFRPEVAELGALSFAEHRALAARYDGRAQWGYTASTSLSYQVPAAGGQAGEAEDEARGEDWLFEGTSRANAAPGEASGDVRAKASLSAKPPAWLRRRDGDSLNIIADDGSTAQLDPLKFCQFLLKVCRERGVKLHQPARVVSVGTSDEGELASVVVVSEEEEEEETRITVPCTRLIITAGCWTPRVFDELFSQHQTMPITNLSGHSVVVRIPPALVGAGDAGDAGGAGAADAENKDGLLPCHALYVAGGSLGFCPEMYSRVGGTLYMAGLNSATTPLPRRSKDSVPQPDKIAEVLQTCREALGASAEDEDLQVVRTGLCHRPVTPWGLPLVLRLSDSQLHAKGESVGAAAAAAIRTRPGPAGGVFVAAGHGPWGITMAPGTGKVLAELAQGRPLSADLSGLGFHDSP